MKRSRERGQEGEIQLRRREQKEDQKGDNKKRYNSGGECRMTKRGDEKKEEQLRRREKNEDEEKGQPEEMQPWRTEQEQQDKTEETRRQQEQPEEAAETRRQEEHNEASSQRVHGCFGYELTMMREREEATERQKQATEGDRNKEGKIG